MSRISEKGLNAIANLKLAMAGTVTAEDNVINNARALTAYEANHVLTVEQRADAAAYDAAFTELHAREAGQVMVDVLKGTVDLSYIESIIRTPDREFGIKMARPTGDVNSESWAAGTSVYHRVELTKTTADIAADLGALMMD